MMICDSTGVPDAAGGGDKAIPADQAGQDGTGRGVEEHRTGGHAGGDQVDGDDAGVEQGFEIGDYTHDHHLEPR